MLGHTCGSSTSSLHRHTCASSPPAADSMDLRKSVRKTLLLLAQVSLLALGFCFICLGAFLLSIQGAGVTGKGLGQTVRAVSAYVSLVAGFLILTTGVFWTLCPGLKSKVYSQHRGPRPNRRALDVHTVDRPDFYPPSYEASLERSSFSAPAIPEAVWVNENEPRYNVAPPLYTPSVAEAPSEDYSGEEPPSYKEAVLQVQNVASTCPRSPATKRLSRRASTGDPTCERGAA